MTCLMTCLTIKVRIACLKGAEGRIACLLTCLTLPEGRTEKLALIDLALTLGE